ncbi:MAG TPA: hypothetical protein PKL08_03075, partial [Thermoanaerobaculaceae bacterium]|nr:hypothetical protein [Thermoanaerobaculaceae bacterium]
VRCAALAEGFRKDAEDHRTHFLRVVAEDRAEGPVATSTGPQGSGILTSMVRANALAVVSGDEGVIPPGGPITLHMTELPEDY